MIHLVDYLTRIDNLVPLVDYLTHIDNLVPSTEICLLLELLLYIYFSLLLFIKKLRDHYPSLSKPPNS